jgi:hypothetical protein
LAALVVRNPQYLERLRNWHKDNNSSISGTWSSDQQFQTMALDNMLFLYQVYREKIEKAQVILTIADCDREFFYSDGIFAKKEPWDNGPLPFDLNIPLTPKLSVAVLPLPDARPSEFIVSRMNAQGVARLNRVVVGEAKNFVYSKSHPPVQFIKNYFGKPAPQAIGYRWVNGQLETKVDRSRDIYPPD